MNKVYGNHLGIVISHAGMDPQQRGRVQIFIPHITNTLYKNWNELMGDIEFTNYDEKIFTPDIINRLRAILPWAEVAAPLFGGGNSAFVNSINGKIGMSPEATLVPDSERSTANNQQFASLPS